MTHKTAGIVLRSIPYGETSLVVTVLTELFGLQTYLVNGVHSAKKGSSKAMQFQPAAILDLLVYHNAQKGLQRIKESGWKVLYAHLMGDVIKNCVALYMVEMLYKCQKQPETNEDLYQFCEEAFVELDKADRIVTANLPLFFALQLPYFMGFRVNDNYDNTHSILDLKEGNFTDQQPSHPYFIDVEKAALTAQLLKVMHPSELALFKLNHESRRSLLLHFQDYYTLHIHDFGQLKTLRVMSEVLS